MSSEARPPSPSSSFKAASAVDSLTTPAAQTSSSLALSTSHSRTMLLLHMNLAIYAFFWWFNQPVFPYLSKQLGADPVTIGTLQSWNQFVMFIGTLFIGRLMDSHGARTTLIASHIFAATSYMLLSCASSIPLLFLSQLPTALMSAMHSSQTLITLLTSQKERSESLGRLSLSYGVGFLLGPVCGGLATNYLKYADLAFISSIGSIIVALEIFILIPDVRADHAVTPSSSPSSSPTSSSTISSFGPFFLLLSNPTVRSIMLVKLFCVFSISLFRSSFSLLSQEVYGLSAQDQGFLLSIVGGVTIVVNTFAIRPLTSRFTDRQIALSSLVITASSFLSFLWLPMRYPLIILWVLPMTASNSIVATVLTGSMTKLAALTNTGVVLGFDMAVGSGARILSPLLGALMVKSGMDGVGGVCALITGMSLLFLNSAFPETIVKQVAVPKEEKEKLK